ncbi:HAD family hydrolase [Arthrobacter sp. 35W]|uniref:HAD family hydrolase n=1 Tax=Arthrobacter sp. 35W TaxID=1132441 RepID=UPI0004146EA7|nr:hypothetical protein [Arthrobacter sp. 35W]
MRTTSLPERPASLQPVLVLDFDGTVCLGDGPVLAYADAVARLLPATAAEQLHHDLALFLANDASAPAHKDGYAAVAAMAGPLLSAAELNAAYAHSRTLLASGAVDVSAPEGLADFLTGLAGAVHRVLLTNAPATGIAQTLDVLGLGGAVDDIIPDANKPSGLVELLPRLLKNRPPRELLSVGDVWANDIFLPWRHGCATAFIDRFDHRTGPASLHAPRFELLYPGITAWAADPAAFALSHPSPTESLQEKAQL